MSAPETCGIRLSGTEWCSEKRPCPKHEHCKACWRRREDCKCAPAPTSTEGAQDDARQVAEAYGLGRALGWREARAAALEEAARAVEVELMHREGGQWAGGRPCTCAACRGLRVVVAAIRALGDAQGEGR